MADAKQPHLNGAYYGPPIPPPRSYHRPGRRSGCGCGCCLLNLLFKLIVTILVIIAILALVFWLVFRPNKVKFHVVNASLTNFSLAGNTLSYNLALNMTIRNPNKHIAIYYDSIEARAYYDGVQFGTDTLEPFYQRHKTTSFLNPLFRGPSPLVLGSSELAQFNSDKAAGSFSIDVKLYLRVRFKLRSIKTNKFKPKIKCDLKVPLVSRRSSAAGFETTRCDIDY
ncbi:PREDICTED: NDR1/HIN1-Like protein 3-like [Nelumbo nucifera]|uniref:NDR1/HIN1-Like protein 3-like n=2 Tax=Nelumbo nucifera TaxID=4432 RepID=A0A1U8AKW9_NELNU|nr:PREDICTED: NDR1/HIN1-Like protein 3-like [Nelumbo nucifera]DAD28921.1 TPA_asm: hypothetical protein HUJ06_030389 [Nelumbo nucifera]